MNICLYQPEIPQNTGNIVRTCAVTGASLTLIRPLGFSLASRHLKRAGLDYWEDVSVTLCDDIEPLLETGRRFYFFSSKAKAPYTSIPYTKDDLLIFGSETKGLPASLWQKWPTQFYTIPQREEARCLNLANAVAIVLYEAWRQQDFSKW